MTRSSRAILITMLAACRAASEPDRGVSGADALGAPVWEADVRLTNDAADSLTTYNFARGVALTADGAVHVAWYDTRDGVSQIYHARSLDGGTTWEPPRAIA